MNVSLATCLARPAQNARTRAAFRPARSLTCLQRSRPLVHGTPLIWTSGLTRGFSWNPFSSGKLHPPVQPPILEAQASSRSSVAEEAVAATTPATQSPSVDGSAATLQNVSAVDATDASETLTDSLSNSAATVAAEVAPSGSIDIASLGWAPWFLDVVHTTTGLPWLSTIVWTTIGVRVALLPLVVYGTCNQAKMAPLQPRLAELRERAQKAKLDQDIFAIKQIQAENMALLKNNGITPLKLMLFPVTQAIVQLGVFLGLRRMCGADIEGFKDGGILWFTDLTAADPTYVLPLLNFAAMNLQLMIARKDMLAVGTSQTPHVFNAMRGLSSIALLFVAWLPAGLQIHILTSISCIMVQTLVLRIPVVRRVLSVPPLPIAGKVKPVTTKETLLSIKRWYRRQQEAAYRKQEEERRKIRMAQSQQRPR